MEHLQYLTRLFKIKPHENSGLTKIVCADLSFITFSAAVTILGLFGLFKDQIVCTDSTHKSLGPRFVESFCWANNTFTEERR